MADTLRIKRRLTVGGAGAPTGLKNAELAYNEASDILYYGKGDSGGNATSVIAIGGPGAFAVGSFLPLTAGPTYPLTGDLWGIKAWPSLQLDKPASGTGVQLIGSTAGKARWVVNLGDAGAESAGAGSDFRVQRFNDAGTYIDSPLVIGRVDGISNFYGHINLLTGKRLYIAAPSGTSVLQIFDDTNSHIEANVALWINGNTLAQTTVGGPLSVNGIVNCGSTVYVNNGSSLVTRDTSNVYSVVMRHTGSGGNGHIDANGGGLYLNHFSTAAVYMAGSTCTASNVGGGELYAGRSLACGSYIWVNGVQWSNNGGYMYTPSSISSASEVRAAGAIWTGGLYWQNNGGQMFTYYDVCSNTVLRCGGTGGPYWYGDSSGRMHTPQGLYTDGNFDAGGSVHALNGIVYLNGMYWRNDGGGWMHTAWSMRSDAQVRANGNLECGGVVTNPWSQGVFVQCYPGGFWDRHCYVTDVNANFYVSPDKSGGIYIYYTGWISDVRWKQNIRNTEIDALGVLRATPVRAFEWTDEGLRIDNYFNRRRDERIGFVAQEIERHIPEAVTILDATPHKSRAVVAAGFVPYLVRAVQQLAEQNVALAARVAQLEGVA